MKASEVKNLIQTTHRVVMVYGQEEFTPNANFLFIVIPKDKRRRGFHGMRWNQDCMRGVLRFIKTKWPEAKEFKPSELICGVEGYDDTPQELKFLDNRIAGDNDRIWIVYPENAPGLSFDEVEFDPVKELG